MITWTKVISLSVALAFVACGKDQQGGEATTSQAPSAKATTAAAAPTAAANTAGQGTKAEAEKLLRKLLDKDTDVVAIMTSLQAKPDDYAAVFVGDAADKAKKAYEEQWEKNKGREGKIRKPDQTELLIWSATSEELKAGTGDASKFPGGYKRITDKIKPGLTWIRWKFVKPGKTSGMAYDGLVFVNGHWAWFPKPWRAIRD